MYSHADGGTGITVNYMPVNKTKLTPITGYNYIVEKELAAIFDRPMRTYLEDIPTYPWMPPAPKTPRINFDLNFKG